MRRGVAVLLLVLLGSTVVRAECFPASEVLRIRQRMTSDVEAERAVHLVGARHEWSIQAAIDDAKPGDTVYIFAGEYTENLLIDKPIQLVGASRREVVLRPADPRRPTVLLRVEEGDATIAGLTTRDGATGIEIRTLQGSAVLVSDVLVVGNAIGIDVQGQGTATIETSCLVDNDRGIHLQAATAAVLDTEVDRGLVGILLAGHGVATIRGCLVGLVERGIVRCSVDCDCMAGEAAVAGELRGGANRIFGTQMDLCPARSAFWPPGFVDEAWRDEVGRIYAAYRERVRQYEAGEDLEEAYETLKRPFTTFFGDSSAPPIYVGFPVLEAYLWSTIGDFVNGFRGFSWAIESYEAAREIYLERAMEEDAAGMDERIGGVQRYMGHYEEALDALGRARVVYLDHGMGIAMAEVDMKLAATADDMGRYAEALERLRMASQAFRDRNMALSAADADAKIGVVGEKLGQYELALDHLGAARGTYEDRGMGAKVASIDFARGRIHLQLGEYQTALQLLTATRKRFEDAGNRSDAAATDTFIGRAYAELGQYELALHRLGAARSAYQDSGAGLALVWVEILLGDVYNELGESQEALEHYFAAEDLYKHHVTEAGLVLGAFFRYVETGGRAILEESNPRVQLADLRRKLGATYSRLGHYEEALTKLREARDAYKRESLSAWVAAVDREMGVAHLKADEYEQALGCFQSALRGLNEIEPSVGKEYSYPGLRWLVLANLGEVYETIRKYEKAVNAYRQCITVVESLREELTTEEFKLSWQEKTKHVYERLIDLLYRMDKTEDAVTVAERCRARTFLDLVAAGPVDTLENVVEDGIRTGVVEVEAIEADLAEVVADLPANTAALECFVTDEAAYVWVIRDGSASAPIRIEIARADLREQVLAFRTVLETPTTGLMDVPDETTLTMSRDLYELLIAPGENELEGIEHLVIVPSGPLYYLPFCALMDCPSCEGADLLGGTYLIERYSLSYAPSLTTLKYAWTSSKGVQTDPLFLAVADPDSRDPVFRRLPDAQDEAETVAGLFEPNEVYVDADATEEVVAARAGEADQILLATHGSFNPYNPMFSYLLLSPTDESDGRLYTHEIFGLDLHTALVTLSACETLLPALEEAKGQVHAVAGEGEDVELTQELLETLTAGDEIVGLTRALLYAGTPTVVSTLWRIVSGTTEPLMVAFYGYLQQGLDKADALRQAQLDVMATYPHPRYWAAFVLMGDWRT